MLERFTVILYHKVSALLAMKLAGSYSARSWRIFLPLRMPFSSMQGELSFRQIFGPPVCRIYIPTWGSRRIVGSQSGWHFLAHADLLLFPKKEEVVLYLQLASSATYSAASRCIDACLKHQNSAVNKPVSVHVYDYTSSKARPRPSCQRVHAPKQAKRCSQQCYCQYRLAASKYKS